MSKVSSDTYQHEFHFLSKSEIFFERQQSYPFDHIEVDVYAGFWSFLFADIPEAGIRLRHNGQNVEIAGKTGILIPPHSVVRWQVLTTQLHWFAYSNSEPYPQNFPKDLTVFHLDQIPNEVSPRWISDLISHHPRSWALNPVAPNRYAKQLKEILDQEYKENRPLAEYASDLGISKEWMIKYFKKSYDITPIVYRNKKRLMQSLFSLHTEDDKIVNLSQKVGFNDLKQFNSLFKQVVRVPPSQFLS